jgi:hypothetical protein
MTNYIKYSEALDFINSESTKIKVVIFSIKDCPTCDDFLPHVFEPLLQELSDHFEWVYVDSESNDIPFPPVSAPTIYFNIPNVLEPMPIFRVGGTTPEILRKDIEKMVDIKDNKISLKEAFSEPIQEITSWVHRFSRFS